MVQPVRAILFDLDGTLLDNDMNLFLPRYFDLLSAHVEHLLPREEFISRLMRATRRMLRRRWPPAVATARRWARRTDTTRRRTRPAGTWPRT